MIDLFYLFNVINLSEDNIFTNIVVVHKVVF
jgi:hypothetical protein